MAFQDDSLSLGSKAESEAGGNALEPDKKLSPEDKKRTRVLVALCYATCCLIWGTTWYAVRISVEPGDGYPPNSAGAIRFAVALLLYTPLWLIFARKMRLPNRSELFWISVAGLLNGLYQRFVYTAEMTISGGLASVIMATSPLMVAVIAICSGIEKVRKQTVIGFCVSFSGLALVCHDRMHAAADQAFGIGLALVAALMASLSNISLKGRGTKLHPVSSAIIFLIATLIPVLAASFIFGEKPVLWPPAIAPFSALVYMAVMSSILAFLLYLYMLRHMSLMAISTLQFVLPILALLMDMFFEKRVVLTPQVWVGIAIVLIGVLLPLRRS
ncbi:MAG: EamA family transporter [Candidatus Obscuribacterales bacterium]|nr:EamA family transporter [Candidatus Obscuribacterales bacterium]